MKVHCSFRLLDVYISSVSETEDLKNKLFLQDECKIMKQTLKGG